MGRELLDSSAVFAGRVRACVEAFGPWVDWSVEAVLRGEVDEGFAGRVEVVQVASFVVMVGLAEVWLSAGVVPDVVVGHSQGEIAAACVAGALSLEDAARVVAVRAGVVSGVLSGRGGMASVGLSEVAVRGWLEGWGGRVSVAAVNGPGSVVVAGDAGVLGEFLGVLEGAGVRVRRIAVDYASHSPEVEVVAGELVEALGGVRSLVPVLPLVSTVTGEWVRAAGVLEGEYWYENLRRPVRFGSVVADLMTAGYSVFTEVSAHPVLVQSVVEVADGLDRVVAVGGSLRRGEGGWGRLLLSLGEVFVAGVDVDWKGLLPSSGRWVELPTYAFDHRDYWLVSEGRGVDVAGLGLTGVDHPLVGAVVSLPSGGGLLGTGRLSVRTHPWLADHRVAGVVVVPGAALVELAVRVGAEVGCGGLDELVVEAPLVLPERGTVRVQVVVGMPDGGGRRPVEIY
ncbi:acyltransferase domain-containing protein, partial [Frankia sp. AgKG'84/4]|nr:acyltransferase domain-containing protein [Frankia sp. AgKG'84/4]